MPWNKLTNDYDFLFFSLFKKERQNLNKQHFILKENMNLVSDTRWGSWVGAHSRSIFTRSGVTMTFLKNVYFFWWMNRWMNVVCKGMDANSSATQTDIIAVVTALPANDSNKKEECETPYNGQQWRCSFILMCVAVFYVVFFS